eukprot:GFYU01001422.1.p1 GENE.GFYU01001422.1~~GFYU01001422.1.p1  ORF type:complete len:368 (+),score=107.70 GFYU01001422.1:101-1204(+)
MTSEAVSVRQAWEITHTGSLDRLTLSTATTKDSVLQEGFVRIKVHACGLNFADVFACLGLYGATPTTTFTPGLEFAGVVIAAGPNSSGRVVGERVFGVTRFGGYSTIIDVDARMIKPLPDKWTFEQGATFPCQALTAYYGMEELGRLSRPVFGVKEKCVLIHSAAGGVGLYCLQIARKQSGVKVIATVGSDSKVEYLINHCGLSREQIVVRAPTSAGFEAQLRGALEFLKCDGIDLVFDAVSGPYYTPGYDLLNPGGHYIIFGAASMMPASNLNVWNITNYVSLAYRYLKRAVLDPLEMIGQNKTVSGFNLIWLTDKLEYFGSVLDDLIALDLEPIRIDKSFPFEKAVDAMKYLQQGRNIGKIVLKV